MDNIDRMYKLKQFIMELYKPCIVEGNNLQGDEYITTFQYNGESPFTFKASDFKRYILKKGDLITLQDNHYARFLR